MPEIRASALAIYAEEGNGNPVLVIRDEWGILRVIANPKPIEAEYINGHLKGYGKVLVIEGDK